MADTYDLLTLAEGKAAIGQDSNSESAFVARLEGAITAVSQRIVDVCGPVVTRTFTNETYDGGDCDIVLRNAGVGALVTTTISSLAEYDRAGSSLTLTAEDYDTKPADGYRLIQRIATIERRSSGYRYRFEPGEDNVVVTYTSARAATTAAVPPKFKTAASTFLAHLWRQQGPQAGAFRTDLDDGPMFGVAPFALPRAVVDMLAHDIKPEKRFGIG